MDLQSIIENYGYAAIALLGLLILTVHFYHHRKHKSAVGGCLDVFKNILPLDQFFGIILFLKQTTALFLS